MPNGRNGLRWLLVLGHWSFVGHWGLVIELSAHATPPPGCRPSGPFQADHQRPHRRPACALPPPPLARRTRDPPPPPPGPVDRPGGRPSDGGAARAIPARPRADRRPDLSAGA